MKKIKTAFGALVLSALLFSTTPVAAQSGDSSSSTSRTTTNENHDDTGKWGLLGLLGLAGLLGLKKKDDPKYGTTDTSTRNRV